MCELMIRGFLLVQDLLSEKGRFYLVAIAQNKPLEIVERMKGRGFAGEVSLPYQCVE